MKIKRFVSCLIAIVMLLSLSSITALAESDSAFVLNDSLVEIEMLDIEPGVTGVAAGEVGIAPIPALDTNEYASASDQAANANNIITIQFRANGGQGSPPPSINVHTPGQSPQPLPGQGNLTRAGHRFDGWRCSQTGTPWAVGARPNWTQQGSGIWALDAAWVSTGSVAPTLTIVPHANWNPPAAGQQLVIRVDTNLPTYSVAGRPQDWMDLVWRTDGVRGFILTARPNTGAARSATISVRGEGVPDRSFVVSQAAGSSGGSGWRELTISRQAQINQHWCWAAVGRIMAVYHGVNIDQTQFFRNTFPNAVIDGLRGANMTEFSRGLINTHSTTFRNARGNGIAESNYQTVIVDQIMAGRPVPVIAWDGRTTMSHMYVVYAAGRNNNQDIVWMYDPWWNVHRNIAVTRTQFLSTGWQDNATQSRVTARSVMRYD